MNMKRALNKGFTLVEMMLVMVIVSVIIYIAMGYFQQRTLQLRLNKAAAQIEQILSAAQNYYVTNGKWPESLNCLKGLGGCSTGSTVPYLPNMMLYNPFFPGGNEFLAFPGGAPLQPPIYSAPNFYVKAFVTVSNSYAYATMLAGMLPLAFTTNGLYKAGSCQPNTVCIVSAAVTPPGYNLNNATSVNYAGLYHSGACVPVPSCPLDASGNPLKAEIIVVPVSVTGANDQPSNENTASCKYNNTSGCQVNAYPLSSFTASATAAAAATYSSGPNSCGSNTPAPCYATSQTINPVPYNSGQYWRVCMAIATQKGVVDPTDEVWGQVSGTVMAITRCSIKNEPSGSDFTVWAP